MVSLVKGLDSCQPEQTIEPDNEVSYIEDNSLNSELAATSSSTSSESLAFSVPTKKTSKVKSKRVSTFNEMLEIMKTVVNNDPMRNHLEYATEGAEKTDSTSFN